MHLQWNLHLPNSSIRATLICSPFLFYLTAIIPSVFIFSQYHHTYRDGQWSSPLVVMKEGVAQYCSAGRMCPFLSRGLTISRRLPTVWFHWRTCHWQIGRKLNIIRNCASLHGSCSAIKTSMFRYFYEYHGFSFF